MRLKYVGKPMADDKLLWVYENIKSIDDFAQRGRHKNNASFILFKKNNREHQEISCKVQQLKSAKEQQLTSTGNHDDRNPEGVTTIYENPYKKQRAAITHFSNMTQ